MQERLQKLKKEKTAKYFILMDEILSCLEINR